jgi:hypothetical protein
MWVRTNVPHILPLSSPIFTLLKTSYKSYPGERRQRKENTTDTLDARKRVESAEQVSTGI